MPEKIDPATQNPEPSSGTISEDVLKRLEAVVQTVSDRDGAVGDYSRQINETTERLNRIEQAIQNIAAGVQVRPQATPATSTLQSLLKPAAPGTSDLQGLTVNDIAGLVKAAVTDAVQPILARDVAREAQSELHAQHKASFLKAAQAVPGIKIAGSPEAQLFDRVLDNRPDLAQLPDAPMLAATIVQGLLATQKVERTDVTRTKQQLNVPTTQRSTAPRGTADIEEVKELHRQLVEKGQTSGLNGPKDMANLIRTHLTLAVNKQDE